MAVVFGSFDEAFAFARDQAAATGKRQVVLFHPVYDRFAVQPHAKLGVWRKAGWIVEDERVYPPRAKVCEICGLSEALHRRFNVVHEPRCPVCGEPKEAGDDTCRWEVCEERFASGCIRCDGNCGGTGECRWDW